MLGCLYRQIWAQGSPNTALRSSFHEQNRRQEENCAVRCYYAASSGNSLPTFRDNLSVPSSMVKNPRRKKKHAGSSTVLRICLCSRRRMGWTEHVARMGGSVYRVLIGKPEGKDHLEDSGVGGRIILR